MMLLLVVGLDYLLVNFFCLISLAAWLTLCAFWPDVYKIGNLAGTTGLFPWLHLFPLLSYAMCL